VQIWLSASASAEFFADIALCPMEMVKVKVQTSPAGTFPTATGAAVAKMVSNKAEFRFPFGSLVPLWSRQIPYTMVRRVGACVCAGFCVLSVSMSLFSFLDIVVAEQLAGQVLLLREDCAALLPARLHQGEVRVAFLNPVSLTFIYSLS
jgi:hypothetical protein